MATPRYDALKLKVRDWAARRENATVPEDIIEDCLKYGIDDVYRVLRIPQMETTLRFTVTEDNLPEGEKYTVFSVPEDLIEFIYVQRISQLDNTRQEMYNEIPDIRTFMDPYAEKYGNFRYVWKDLEFYVHPRLAVGDVIELHYYRRLGQLDALYSVVPENYDLNYAPSNQ